MHRLPPVLRACAALVLAYLLLLAVARAGLLPAALQGAKAVGIMGILAAGAGLGFGLAPGWVAPLLLLPWAMDALLRSALPAWTWPLGLLLLLLVFGGGLFTRVPLYHSNRAAWAALLGLCPASLLRFADLGAGFGGPLAHLARNRPDGFFLGVEASPFPFLVAWLRTLPLRGNCAVRLGSLWALDLAGYDVVYAFLSPAPMPRLWEKARREMRPGTLLVSNTFEIPGVTPEARIPLPGRRDACLYLYRM
ncbi:class I SAM-dependent methyltransferase [Mesoterricola sediminis]|uniref:Class I SAM-dependent methyltransferase n=1 Tax=Mesoterricola sediminis TaxID=2927980 RepID=A0AA48GT77_9BACT|nr:class I SAM-dependent methyltransferase [Mesoterricola sediminis]BDU75749.1 hypothetical protein METESE_07070 [Mesoterricola sediminis]